MGRIGRGRGIGVGLGLGLWISFGLGACGEQLPAHEFSGEAIELRTIDGLLHQPVPSQGGPVTVLVFTASDCPVANGYAPEIRAIESDYGEASEHGVRVLVVNIETGTSTEALAKHAAEYELPGPILLDPQHTLATWAGATVTPEAVVVKPGGAIAYRGRIDDQYADLGVRRPAPSTTDLRDALDSVLAKRPVATPETAAVGCFIEDWKR